MMSPKEMREAAVLLDYRRATRQLIADTQGMSVYALELRLPARDGRIYVLSNDQPGAQRELVEASNRKICDCVVASLIDELQVLGERLTKMGVDIEAADQEDSISEQRRLEAAGQSVLKL